MVAPPPTRCDWLSDTAPLGRSFEAYRRTIHPTAAAAAAATGWKKQDLGSGISQSDRCHLVGDRDRGKGRIELGIGQPAAGYRGLQDQQLREKSSEGKLGPGQGRRVRVRFFLSRREGRDLTKSSFGSAWTGKAGRQKEEHVWQRNTTTAVSVLLQRRENTPGIQNMNI